MTIITIDVKKNLDERRRKYPNIAFAKIFFLGKIQVLCDKKKIPLHILESCSSERLQALSHDPKLGEVDTIKKDHEIVCIIHYRQGKSFYKKPNPPEDGEVRQGDLWPSY